MSSDPERDEHGEERRADEPDVDAPDAGGDSPEQATGDSPEQAGGEPPAPPPPPPPPPGPPPGGGEGQPGGTPPTSGVAPPSGQAPPPQPPGGPGAPGAPAAGGGAGVAGGTAEPAWPPPGQAARNWAVGAHLSAFITFLGLPWFLGPLIVWLIKREDDPFIDDQGKEAVNFNLSVLIYGAAFVLLAIVLSIITVGIGLFVLVPLGLAIVVAWFVLVIVAAVKASSGERYRYPLTLRLIT